MKKLITTLLAFSLYVNSYAQTTVYDSVYLGAGYAKQIYYSLANDSVGFAPVTSWDFGFITTLEDASIIVNHVKGITVYKIPNQDTSAWNTLDTTGINSWKKLYNSDQSWSNGAFSTTRTADQFDFGWGTFFLTGPQAYNVVGDDTLYVLQTPGGWKKLRLISKLGLLNSYIFRIANLDGSMDNTFTINATSYATAKNFIYYDIASNSVVNIEPDKSTWDILFTQYRSIPVNPGPPVTGVLSNIGVKVAKAAKVDTASVKYSAYSGALSDNLSAIGYDWKTYTGIYTIEDSLVYFVKTNSNTVYKLWFTGFGGSANGKIAFGKQEVQLVSSGQILKGSEIEAATYPNPSTGKFDIVCSTTKNADAVISVFDLSGRNAWNEKVMVKNGLNVIPVSMINVTPGSYFVKVMQDGEVVNLKMIVTK